MQRGTLVFEDGSIYRVAFEPVQVQAPPAAPPQPPPPKVPITAINCLCSHTAKYHDPQTGYCRASDSGDICPCREFRFPGTAQSAAPSPHQFDPGDSVACRVCGLDYYAHAKERP